MIWVFVGIVGGFVLGIAATAAWVAYRFKDIW